MKLGHEVMNGCQALQWPKPKCSRAEQWSLHTNVRQCGFGFASVARIPVPYGLAVRADSTLKRLSVLAMFVVVLPG